MINLRPCIYRIEPQTMTLKNIVEGSLAFDISKWLARIYLRFLNLLPNLVTL